MSMIVTTPDFDLAVIIENDTIVGAQILESESIVRTDNVVSDNLRTQIKQQIAAYFSGLSTHFELPLQLRGTDFQVRVWQSLMEIPIGSTLQYGELAKSLGSSAQAVGNACRQNPIPFLVPCHRVVARNGIGGFSGATEGKWIQIKKSLLLHELETYGQHRLFS